MRQEVPVLSFSPAQRFPASIGAPTSIHGERVAVDEARVEAYRSVMRFCSSIDLDRSCSSRAMARLIMPINAPLSALERL
jgi:hypothetical protein